MERLRFDPYAPATAQYMSRRLGEQASAKQTSVQGQSRAVRNSHSEAQHATEEGLARAFIIPQSSVFPQYEPCEGLRRGTLFIALDKPLEGVNCCGTK